MGRSQPLILTILIFLSFSLSGALADEAIVEDPVALEPADADSSLKAEHELLRSKISILDSRIADYAEKLKSKDDAIARMDQIIQEKSARVFALQKEVQEVEAKGAVDAAELLEKAHARAAGLEKQIEALRTELQVQSQKKDALEARASATEKRIEELKLKLERLQKINEEQIQRMKETSYALKIAEEGLLRTRKEVVSKKNELTDIYEAWLPPWLAGHVEYYQDYAAFKWKRYGKPAFDTCVQKVSEVATQVHERIEPHLDSVKAKCLPILEEKWTDISLFVKPHMQSASAKAVEFYANSITTIQPHVRRVQEVTHPHILRAKEISKPYVDQVATITRPHVENFRVALKPYTQKVVHQYAKFITSATAYHLQVQASVQENLMKYELTRALATKESVWGLASVCLAFPVYLFYEAFTYMFCKRSRKSTRNRRATTNSRQKNKRRHADK